MTVARNSRRAFVRVYTAAINNAAAGCRNRPRARIERAEKFPRPARSMRSDSGILDAFRDPPTMNLRY